MQDIINEMDAALGKTLELLDSFNETELNTVPFKGSWTAAQVFRHLQKSEANSAQLFTAPGKKPDRASDERVAKYKGMLMDFETKLQSPAFIVPEEKIYTYEELEQPLREYRQNIIEAVKSNDLEATANLPEDNPLLGSTKLELVHFLTYHTIRHNHQITKIKEALDAKN